MGQRGVTPEDRRHFLSWDLDSDAQRHGWQLWPPYGEEAAKEFAKLSRLRFARGKGGDRVEASMLATLPKGVVRR